jgi:FAD/FMN-containing dehydrogenase
VSTELERRSFLRWGMSAATVAAVGAGTGVGGATARATTAPNWTTLRTAIDGDVVLPGDAGYDQAIRLHQAQFDVIRPQAVVFCESAADVRDTLLFSQDNDLPVAPRSGGHSGGGYSTTTGVVVDVSRIAQVSVGSGQVTIGAGIKSVDAANALASTGLVLPNGTCPTVAAGGFVTGGGIGPITRDYGVASDGLAAAEVVLADGRIVRCSPRENTDLYWALRGGGGGNFGIVTRYRLRALPVTRLADYAVVWPISAATEVIGAWQAWLAALPRGVFAELLVAFPPNGNPVVQASGTATDSQADLETQLNRLTGAIGTAPLARQVTDDTYQRTMMKVWGCSTRTVAQCHTVGQNPEATLPRGAFGHTRGRFIGRALSDQAIGQIMTAVQQDIRPAQLRVLALRAMGGAANAVSRSATAFVHRTSLYNINCVFSLLNPSATDADRAALLASLNATFAAVDPHSNAESFQNFMDPVLADWRQAYYAENYSRLVDTKRRYDPNGFFRFPQAIGS